MLIKRIQISLWDIIISGLLAIMFTVSPMFINTGRCSFTVREAGMAAFYFTLFIAGAALIRLFLIKFQYKFIFFEPILNHKHALIILTGIMFLLWLTILIILYPGTVINDTWGQLSQFVYTFYSDNKIHLEYLGDHHPVLTTFIMGQIIIPLANMVSNLQVAMFIYVILQAILTVNGRKRAFLTASYFSVTILTN